MADEELETLRVQQARCLRLAAACDRPEIIRELKLMAEEYAEMVRRILAPARREWKDEQGLDGR